MISAAPSLFQSIFFLFYLLLLEDTRRHRYTHRDISNAHSLGSPSIEYVCAPRMMTCFFVFVFCFFFFYFSDRCTGCLPCVTRLMLRLVSWQCPLSRPYGGVCRSALRSHSFQVRILRRKHPERSILSYLFKGVLISIGSGKPYMVKVHFFLSFFFFISPS